MATITLADISDENGVLLPDGDYTYVAVVGPAGAQSAIDNTNDVTLTDGGGSITVGAAVEHTVWLNNGANWLQKRYTAA